jgi:methylmalonyl-CoA mutase N-terminal domain/subunit
VIVGVNRFQQENEAKIPTFKVDPELERRQVERVREVRASRSASAVAERLARLEAAARGSDNLLPCIVECCESFATVGEISDTLRGVYGEYQEQLV